MRSYEEISNRIMQRGDDILDARKKRTSRIKHISYAVSGICAAAIVGVWGWHTSTMNKPGHSFGSGDITITEETTAISTTSSVALSATSTMTQMTSLTSASAVTETSADITSEIDVTTEIQTQAEESDVTIEDDPPVQEDVTDEGVTNEDTPQNPTELDIKRIFSDSKATFTAIKSESGSDSPGSIIQPKNGGLPKKTPEYEKDNIVIQAEDIGSLIGTASVQIGEGDSAIVMEMEVYEILDTDSKDAVAVRLADTDVYYRFNSRG